MVAQLQAEQGVEKVIIFLVKTHWASSVTGLVLVVAGYAGRKPASGSGGGDPKTRFQGTESLNTLRDRITQINGMTKCGWMTAGLPVWRR